jgi:hypothetical protein
METTVEQVSGAVRQIQALAVLLFLLPAGGRAREFFSLALSLDEGPWLDRITPLTDTATDEGIQAWLKRVNGVFDVPSDEALTSWLEFLWIRSGLSSQEQALVDWQEDPANMSAAVAEYLAAVGTP